MGNEETDREKLIKLETQLELMFKMFTESIARLEKKLDYREETYVTKDVLTIQLSNQDHKINSIKQEIQEMKENKKESRTLWPVWLGLAITAVLGALALYK